MKTIFHIRNCKRLRACAPSRQSHGSVISFYFYVLDSVYWHNLISFINAISLRARLARYLNASPSEVRLIRASELFSLETKRNPVRCFYDVIDRLLKISFFQSARCAADCKSFFMRPVLDWRSCGGRKTATASGIDLSISSDGFLHGASRGYN